MGAKIDYYYDCVSPYSYYALLYLVKNRDSLKSHEVELELHPVFLGGIMQKSTNTPPWKLPAKANYSRYDGGRAQKYFGVNFKTPDFFPILSLLPQRCMTFVKDNYSAEKLEAISLELWKAMWEEHMDLSKPDLMRETLSRHFSAKQADQIMAAANTSAVKDKLLATTDRALQAGAFGCPWFEVTNSQGIKEPFFGSDRFHYMWDFLGLPWKDIEIVHKSKI